MAVVGWQHNFGRVLRALDQRLPKGSTIVILSKLHVRERRRDLASSGMSEQGGPLEMEAFLRSKSGSNKQGRPLERQRSPTPVRAGSYAAGLRREPREGGSPNTSPSRRSSISLPPALIPQTSEPSGSSTHPIPGITGLENCTLVHRVGDPTEELALRQLPLKRMDVALVFAGVDLTHHGPLRSHGGTELQIQDSEAILTLTLTLILTLTLTLTQPQP